MATTPRYEYNVYDGYYFAPGVEGMIGVARNPLQINEDGSREGRYSETEGESWRHIYDPEGIELPYITDGDAWFDFDDPDLPWFVPLLDFETERMDSVDEYKAGDRVLSFKGDAGTIREAWGTEEGYNVPHYYVTWDDGYNEPHRYYHEDLEPLTEKEN